MVTFTCHNCGDSVKKPKVDKHINIECKKRKYGHAKLCCIDCLNDFDAESYVKHTSCISEAERYSAPGYVAKQSSNKGERKQNSWISVMNSVSNRSDLTGSQRQLLNAINQFENVPRKRSKFQNFIKSSVRHIRVNPQTVDQLYDLLEQAFKSTSDQNTNNVKKADQTISSSDTNGPSENSNTVASEPQNEKKKRKLESSQEASLSDNGGENESTNVPNGTSKKKKKRKRDGDSENQNNEADAVEPQSAFNSANDDSSNVPLECDERTKKKKKKREHLDGVENLNDTTNSAVDTENIEDNESSTLNNDFSEKKRKKKKKRVKSDSNEAPSGGDSLPDTCNVENQCSAEKKKKKSSHKTNGDLSELSEQTIESTEQPAKTKSKKQKIANVDEATTTITTNGCTVEEPESETQAHKEDKELRKKNKKKKNQNGDSEAVELNKSDGDMAVDDSIVCEDEGKAAAQIISEPTKKRKKRKHDEASAEIVPQSEDLQMDGLSENGTSKKKKKKKSKTE